MSLLYAVCMQNALNTPTYLLRSDQICNQPHLRHSTIMSRQDITLPATGLDQLPTGC